MCSGKCWSVSAGLMQHLGSEQLGVIGGDERSQGGGACLEELEGSANVVKAASVAWRPLTHDAERWSCELDWMVDGVGD